MNIPKREEKHLISSHCKSNNLFINLNLPDVIVIELSAFLKKLKYHLIIVMPVHMQDIAT